MNLGKQKILLIIILLASLFSLVVVKPADVKEYKLLDGGIEPPPPPVPYGGGSFPPFSLPPAGPGMAVVIAADVPSTWDRIKKIIGGAMWSVLWSAADYGAKYVAYETAIYVASGNFGQKPLFLTSAGFEQLVDGMAGEAIYALGNNIEFLKEYGINLCVPPDLNFQLWLSLNLTEEVAPTPRCSLKQIREAWDRVDEPNYWKGVGVGLRPGQNDLSLLMAANQAVKEISARKKEEVKEEMTYRGQSIPPTNVAGDAKMPVSFIEKLAEDLTGGTKDLEFLKTQSTADSFKTGDWSGAAINLSLNLVKNFTNTLSSELLKKGMSGMYSLADLFLPAEENTVASPEAQVVGGRQVAEIAFAEFLKPNLLSVDQWNYTAELAVDCSIKSPYCGVLDSNFNDVLTKSAAGGVITVKEALGKGLYGEWSLLPPSSDCQREAYCYENLVKLRQLRILPIGWELAAKVSPPTNVPITLQEAIDAFSDQNSPYYHLIDPYWILKAPVAKCGAMAYSANFILPPATDGTGGQRAEYCADVQNCVEEDEAGQCPSGSWGYCLKEKNRWILGADSCDAQFNTCTTYANSKGQTASYLANTIEKSICNADNVGCRAYAVSSILKNDKWEWDLVSSAAQKIYFNAKAAQCDYSNEGCSQFVRTGFGLIGGAEVSNEKVNLKKAPEYYNCYGEMRASVPIPWEFSSSTLQWAVNKADLSKIFDSWKPQNKEKCDNFAQVCSYDEVGCEKYTPTNGDLPIPGILTANDQCPSACVGYESFIQQDTNFEYAPASSTYFIPAEPAKFCTETEAGCDEFVNLEAQTVGGESKEYYTELRQCSQTETDGAVYYTWEGSDTAGYQLRSFNLKKSADGSPVSTITLNDNSSNPDDNTCGVNSYKDKKADPDCREFYDKDGSKSYRLYTKTITVSATDCKKLRKTVSDEISCNATSGSWEPTQKICTYLAIPKEGQSCKAAAVGCREYKGNAGNNFYPLDGFPITFENGAVGGEAQQSTGWAGKFSAESTVVGGKSLKVSNGHTEITKSLAKGTTYSLSFWAKGLGEGLDVSVVPSLTDSQGNPVAPPVTTALTPFSLTLHADWQNYTVGPIVIVWDESAASSTVRFDSASGKVFYLDNIVAKQMSGNIYVVKNSWKTPSACDNLIGDEYGQSQGGSFTNPYRLVPQAMLGCQKYTDRQNQEVAVKSFTSMCREEAVGCEEFVDTENTFKTPFASFANLKCTLLVMNDSNQAVACKDKDNQERCSVAPGAKDCKFDFVDEKNEFKMSVWPNNWPDNWDKFIASTLGNDIDKSEAVFTPADSKEYLVNDKNYYCANDALGCSALGPISYNAKNTAEAPSSVYLKNQPEIYGQILCEQKAEGCEEFKTTQGTVYFKDPGVKNNFCEYQNDINGSGVAGWVKKDLGSCEGLSWGVLACSSDADCQKVGNKKCDKDKKVACDYPAVDNVLFKNGDPDYKGVVGLCPSEQNGCSEFIDPMDTTPIHTSGTPYFVINNSKLDRADCGNQAGLQEGCVLFNETSKGTLNWNASSTYKKSDAIALNNQNKNNKVNPIDCGSDGKKDSDGCSTNTTADKNDSNTILKVQRDRVCGEWLACKSSMSVRDDNSSSGFKEMCTELAPCLEADSKTSILTGKCGKWAPKNGDDGVVIKGQLTVDNYTKRDVTWWGNDYSGYTLPEAYQIQTLSVVGKNLGHGTAGVFITPLALKDPISQSCRGFAQADMPDKFSDGSTDACSYTKVTYSAQNSESFTKYLPYNQLLGAEGVCSGGFDDLGASKKYLPCVHFGNCTDDRPLTNPAEAAFAIKEHGICMMLQQPITKSRGWEGYCLDPAALNAAASAAPANKQGAKPSSKNCTLWYPLITPSGSVSSDHLYASAGYVPPAGSGKYWCLQAEGNSNLNPDSVSYAYTAYKNARQFYPHTSEGYNGNACSQSSCYNQDGQSSCTCPGEFNTYVSYYVNGKAGAYAYSDYTLTIKQGNELITTYNKEPLHISKVVAIGLIPTGNYYNKDDGYYDDTWPANPSYIFRDQRLAGIKNIYQDGKDGRYWSGPLKKFGDYWVMDLAWHMGGDTHGSQPLEINYDAITKAACEQKLSVGVEAAAMGFRAYFNADGELKKIGTKICDAGSSETGMQMDLVFYLSEVCTDIRQVVDTDSEAAINSPMGFLAKGRTDRLAFGSPYKVGADLVEKNNKPAPLVPLDLPYNQTFAPFGSFSQSRDPITSSLSDYTKQFKTNYAQTNALRQAGFWPIWSMPGGATPLSCAKDSFGDCGNLAICSKGNNIGKPCDPTKDDKENGCETIIPAGYCDYTNKICAGTTKTDEEVSIYKISCEKNEDCEDKFSSVKNYCTTIDSKKVCLSTPDIICTMDDDCLPKDKIICDFDTSVKYCVGGVKNKSECTDDSNKCVGGSIYKAGSCSLEKNIRGLCVGGQNHGQFCGGNLDCPPKKYPDSEDITEYGVCVGAALNYNTAIPKNDTSGTGFGRGLERLLELFPAWFNTWEWKDNQYTLYQDNNKNKDNSSLGFHTFENKWDYTKGHNVKFDVTTGCSNYPTESCNPKANVDPKSPTAQFVDEQNNLITGNPTIKGAGSLNFILRFNASADHDQMPIVRMAVDWGDDSDPYVMQGWFKNRKALCGVKVCSGDLNIGCNNDNDCGSNKPCKKESHFGNSSDACEEGYYQFTHIYECKSGGAGWNASTNFCKFVPKVQVLDNWGWCNSSDGKGRWNDEIDSTTKKIKDEKDRQCFTGSPNTNNPWTSFGGTIEVKK